MGAGMLLSAASSHGCSEGDCTTIANCSGSGSGSHSISSRMVVERACQVAHVPEGGQPVLQFSPGVVHVHRQPGR